MARLDAGESTRAAARFALVCGVCDPHRVCSAVASWLLRRLWRTFLAIDEEWRVGD